MVLKVPLKENKQDGSSKNLISRSYKNLKNDGSLETEPRKRSRLLMTDN